MKTIHYITTGRACCGMDGLPSDWPEDHLWSLEWEHVTCQGCLATKEGEKDLTEIEVKQKPKPPSGKDKTPCYTDTDFMPFGKHKGKSLYDVPASYLHWLWTQRPIQDIRLENYIHNNINHLKREHPDGIWT